MAEDVIPYTALMPELDAIMLTHVMFPEVDPEFPASLSRRIVTGWLRDQLGFDKHLVMTDDMDMGAITSRDARHENVKLAIQAGNDLAMICHKTDTAGNAANAIAEVPIGIRDDARARIAGFRRKMSAPLDFSETRWETICGKISDVVSAIPEPGIADDRSAVTRY